jgi:hypothetical protein
VGTARRLARRIVVAFIAALVAACAQFPDKVCVGLGTAGYVSQDAAAYAALYLPYAKMAELSYTDSPGCPAEAGPRGWTCRFGTDAIGLCPARAVCAPGLAIQVWRKEGCGEAVIAFQGTNWTQLGDVLSNFRWFFRTSQLDEYTQVQFALRKIVARIRAECAKAPIIATGRSLGGGLAQFAGYLDPQIKYVYAFDPSPVTAYFQVPPKIRERTVQYLGIDRVYETGEALSFPRHLISGMFPASDCRPLVRTVQFNIPAPPSLVARHSMQVLVHAFENAPQVSGHLPDGFTEARKCRKTASGGAGNE